MFKDIVVIERAENSTYRVYDSNFTKTISIQNTDLNIFMEELVAIISLYAEMNLCVPQNVAKFYCLYSLLHLEHSLLERHANAIDKYFPHLSYKTKYLACVKRQVRQLKFSSPILYVY